MATRKPKAKSNSKKMVWEKGDVQIFKSEADFRKAAAKNKKKK